MKTMASLGKILGDPCPKIALAMILLAAGLGPSVTYAIPAWTIDAATEELLTLELSDGSIQVIGPAEDLGFVGALATAPDGTLYGAEGSGAQRLFTVDRTTGQVLPIAPLQPARRAEDMAFDSAGDLWLIEDGSLFRVDRSTAETALVGQPQHPLLAIAPWDDQLYGIEEVQGGDPREHFLVRIDPATAITTRLSDTPIPPPGIGCSAVFLDMDFTPDGVLWILTVEVVLCIVPPPPDHSLYRIADITAPEPELVHFLGAGPFFGGFSIGPPGFPPITEVPTLGTLGTALLGLLLLVCGCWRLRRRKSA